MKEVWKDVEGFDGSVQVSNLGNVRNIVLGVTYKQQRHPQGYMRIGIRYKGQPKKNLSVHRLVAKAFLENPEGKLTVNHINGNHADNNVLNLEWSTQAENNQHAYETGLKNNDHLRVINPEAINFIRENYIPYDKEFGATPLAKLLGLSISQVSRVAKHKYYKEEVHE